MNEIDNNNKGSKKTKQNGLLILSKDSIKTSIMKTIFEPGGRVSLRNRVDSSKVS